jgi:hypothetical protein
MQISADQRLARLATRHLLTGKQAADPVEAAAAMVGLHATDPATVILSALARMRSPSVAAIEKALYVDRTLLRLLGMRRTMFTAPRDLAAVIQASSTRAIAVRERRLAIKMIEEGGVASDGAAWLKEAEEATLAALAELGEATAAEISAAVPMMRAKVMLAAGSAYAAEQSVSTRVLFVLASDGRIARGRPKGSWISSQVRWSTMDYWLPGGLADLPVDEARVELVRRWLTAFGPGTPADIKWWTGWTLGEVRKALAALGAVEVDLDGATGALLPGDVARVKAPAKPWVALLPALDPTVMGWQSRRWYLGPHIPALFDRNGNAGPTVWCHGRVVGGWAQRKDGEIVWRMLEDVGSDAVAAVEDAAARLHGHLEGVRVTPRFRTPLEQELTR